MRNLSPWVRSVAAPLLFLAGINVCMGPTGCAFGKKGDEGSENEGTSAGDASSSDSNGTAGGTALGTTTQTVVTGTARFRLVGRFDKSKAATPTFSVAGSRVGVAFSGTSLTALITDTGSDGFDVIVDGALKGNIQLNPSTTPVSYPVVTGLASGQHTAWLVKRTEALQVASDGTNLRTGTITINDMTVDSGASFYTPPLAKTRRLEAYGDSSFSGYGVDILCGDTPANTCSNLNNRYSPRTQDALKSIPGAAATALGADLVNVSFTGQGVIYGYYDAGNCNAAAGITTRCLPTISGQTLPPNATPAYDFSEPADVVLMCAGGDDLAGDAGSGAFPAGDAAFSTAYAKWLGEIRSHYPKATIVVTLSPAARGNDITTLGNALQAAVAQAQAAQPGSTDPNMLYFNYYSGTTYQTYQDIATQLKFYYGGYGHPSAGGSQWLGQQAAAFIATHMGWTANNAATPQ